MAKLPPNRKPHPTPPPDTPFGYHRVDPNNAQRWEMITLKMLDRPEPDYKYLIPQSLWCRLHNIHTLCVRSWNGGLHSRQVIATVIVDWAEKAEMLEEIL